jgi:hypothetical protein
MASFSLNELVDLLSSTDPQLRDELAYGQLAILENEWPEVRRN